MTPAKEQLKNGMALRFFREYWFVVALIFSIAFAWANLKRDVQENSITNEDQDERIEMSAGVMNSLNSRYIEDITFIKTTLEEIKEDLK